MNKALKVFFSIIYFAFLTHLYAKVLTLEEAEHRAVTLGFEPRIKYLEQKAKEWEKKNVISNYLPKINYNLSYSRLDDSTIINAGKSSEIFGEIVMDVELIKQVITTITDDPIKNILDPSGQQNSSSGGSANPNAVYKNSLTHEFSFNQPISNGGVEIVAIRMAKLTKKAIDLQIESTRLETIYNTRKAYFDAISAIERKKVTKHDLSWNLNNLKKARTKHSTGNIPKTDVLQWEAEVAKKESEVIEAEATMKFMLLNLFNTMGMTDVNIDTVQLQPFEVFEQWYKRGPIPTQCLVDSNFQYKMVQMYTKIAQENKNIALTSFLPKLNGFFTVSYKQGWEKHLKDMFDKDKFRPTWVAGLVLNIPLFSGFANPTNYQKSKYEY
ncbi:MAG: TolC family protein, partial [Chitinispirillia bacterium]